MTPSNDPKSDTRKDQEPAEPLGRRPRALQKAKDRYEGSAAEHTWGRLSATDFINRAMLFAAILLLCLLPSFIVLNALAGRNTVESLSKRFGLNQEAARDVSRLFTSTSSTSNALTVGSYVFFVLGLIAVAAAVQELYERSFQLERRGRSDVLRQLIWLGVMLGGTALVGWAGPPLRRTGGPVLAGILGLVVLTAFWWWTMWFLLSARIAWRELFAPAIATALFWLGMGVFFSHYFSSTVIANNDKYGSIGIIFALMSYLIAMGVVIVLGAVVGAVWRERNLSFKSAFKRMRREPPRSDATGK